MNWMPVAGTALLLLGAYILGHAMWLMPVPQRSMAETGNSDEEMDRIAARVRSAVEDMHARRRIRLLRLGLALLLLGIFFLALPGSPNEPLNKGSLSTGEQTANTSLCPGIKNSQSEYCTSSYLENEGSPQPKNQNAGGSSVDINAHRSHAIDMSYLIIGLLILSGGGLALFARPMWVKATGVAAIGVAAALHGLTLFRVEKLISVDNLVKIDGKINFDTQLQLKIQAEVDARLKALGRFRPQYLGSVDGFAIGEATIDAKGFGGEDSLNAAKAKLAALCSKWTVTQPGDALLLVAGSTDRLPLAGAVRSRYEANTGLAQARAANVQRYLGEHCGSWIDTGSARVLLLAAGPSTTPEHVDVNERRQGHMSDRRVDVWVMSVDSTVQR